VGIRTPTLIKKVSRINIREVLGYAYYGGIVFAILLILVYFKPSFMHHLWDSKIESVDVGTPTRLVHKAQVHQIKNALEVYYLEKGQYPNRLDELVSARLLRRDDLFYRQGISYQYELKDGKYILKH
jgi:hypothetical protein